MSKDRSHPHVGESRSGQVFSALALGLGFLGDRRRFQALAQSLGQPVNVGVGEITPRRVEIKLDELDRAVGFTNGND